MNASNPSKAEWRKVVNAMCKACIYDANSPGTWRAQTQACTAPHCPQWKVRPISSEPLPKALVDDLRRIGVRESVLSACVEISLPGDAELTDSDQSSDKENGGPKTAEIHSSTNFNGEDEAICVT